MHIVSLVVKGNLLKHRKVSKYYETVDTKSQLTPTILIFFLDQISSNRVFPGETGNFACVHGRYFLFRTRADRHNSILMSLLLLVAETIKAIVGRYTDDTNLTIMLLQVYPYVCINIFLCLSRHIKFYPTPCLLIKCKTAFFYKILIACFFLITFQHIVAKRFWFGLSSKWKTHSVNINRLTLQHWPWKCYFIKTKHFNLLDKTISIVLF